MIKAVMNFKIHGKRAASAATEVSMQRIARIMFVLKKNVTTAVTRQIMPMTSVALLNLYAVSLLSKMMSLMDVFNALRIALKGIRHSIRTEPSITPITRPTGNAGISNWTALPSESVPLNMTLNKGFLIAA